MAVHHKAGAAMHHHGGKALAKHHRKKKAKKRGKKRGKKAAKKHGKKHGKKKSAKKTTRRRRRGQKGPNIITHKDPDGLGSARVKCPARKAAVVTIAKHRRSGTYVYHARCV